MSLERSFAPRPRRTRRLAALAFVAAAVLTATACGGGDADETADGRLASEAQAKPGGSLELLAVADMLRLDPFGALSNYYLDNTRLNALYDSLMYSEPKTGRAVPHIAESFVADPAGTTWTLKIRPNVTFTDGTAYDAAAVKWTWDEHKKPERRSLVAGSAAAIKESRVVDPLTLQVTLNVPNANFDRVVASSLAFIPSPTAMRNDPAGFGRKPVGAGPFVLTEHVQDSHLTMTKNPTYWQAGKPLLDKVTFRTVVDSDQSMNSVVSGQSDLKVSGGVTDGAKARQRGLGIEQVAVITGEVVVFNHAKPPFDDVRARRAVALALDPQGINKIVFNDQGAATASMFPAGSPLVNADAPPLPSANRAEAQRLADELAAEGKPLNFTYRIPQNNQAAKTGEYIQQQLIGLKNVQVRIESLSVNAYTTAVRVQRDFEMAQHSWNVADVEPSVYSYLHSSSPTNFMGYKSQAVDQLLERGRVTSDPAQRALAYSDLMRQVAQDVPLWPYQEGRITAYYRDTVGGLVLSQDGMLLMDRLGRRA